MIGTLPRFEDHFPSTRVGHGSSHGPLPADATSARRKKIAKCSQSTCELNRPKGGDKHQSHGDSVDDWREDHKLPRLTKKKEFRQPAVKLGPMPVITDNPPKSNKCSSCGHVPNGEVKDPMLMLGVCSRCWKRGYSMHKSLKEGQE